MDLLKALCHTPGISGREHRIRNLILTHAKPLFDNITTDPMGSLLCTRNPRPASKSKTPAKPLKIMLAAHMDQIGFIVKHIDDRGFLRLANVGGFDPRTLFARNVTVCTEDSGDIPGLLQVAGKPLHLSTEDERKKIPDIADFFVDLGLPAAAVKKQVKLGDMVVLDSPFTLLGKHVAARALDNRLACWLVIRALQQLTHHHCQIHAVFTVQEEVGLRGAATAAYEIKPDIGLGIDSTACVDTPGVAEDQRVAPLGKGAVLTVMDGSVISDISLVQDFERVAQKHKIHCCRSLGRGGTDTASLQRAASGCRAMAFSCPVRYIHTITEMLDTTDLYACRDLLAAFLAQAK